MNLKILIADEQALFSARLARLLTVLDEVAEVKLAADGESLTETMKILEPDLIFVSLGLGDAVIKAMLKSVTAQQQPPKSIVIANREDPLLERLCLEAGADKVLIRSEVLQSIDELIPRSRYPEGQEWLVQPELQD